MNKKLYILSEVDMSYFFKSVKEVTTPSPSKGGEYLEANGGG